MEKNEAEFMSKLLETFKTEAKEHLQVISDGLLALEGDLPESQKKELIEKIFREAHSLKGASRAINLVTVQDFCQTIENVLAAWKRRQIISSQELFDTLHASLDLIEQMVFSPAKGQSNQSDSISLLTQKIDQLLKEKKEEIPPAAASMQPKTAEKEKTIVVVKEPAISKAEATKPHSHDIAEIFHREQTIRVSIHKLDRLFQQVEELLNLKLAARQQTSDLKQIQETLKQWDKKWGRLRSDVHSLQEFMETSERSDSSEFSKKILDFFEWQQNFIKSLQENLNRLVKITSQDYRLVGGVVDTLLEDTKKVLMQPFSTLLESFPRMVRDLSQELNKKINFECQGGDIEVDRRILEEMKDPLIHLIRNSIDHGIGTPEERAKKNKPPQGTIKVSASQISGNSMEILVSDDGEGVNIQKVKDSAVKNGLLTQKDADLISGQEAAMLIFQSGLSTSAVITELSGRGLGLGIVSEKVDKLGGQVFVETKQGLGAIFRIVLPLTLATFRGIHIKISGRDFIMPTHNVQRVIRIDKRKINTVENRETISIDGRALAYISLSDLLEIEGAVEESRDKFLSILVVKAAEKTVAFGVDKVLGEQDVLVKGLGRQLLRIKNTVAATITEWGTVIPILNPQDLVKSVIKGVPNKISTALSAPVEARKAVILLAEDSITSRMLLKNILESAGFEVKTAVDGAEAFSIFKTDAIDLLLTDIEMPRMDGFVLTEKVRALEKGRDLPIVLCTSRESKEDREHGIEIGANAYLEKSNFTQNNLLDVIKKLL